MNIPYSGVMILWSLFGGMVHNAGDFIVTPVYAQTEHKVILVEGRTEWTEERIIEEIDRVFPDAPLMLAVARCEGIRDGKLVADALHKNKDGTDDLGPFQINSIHNPQMKALGLNRENPADNIKFAHILYEDSGLKPWSASKSCWNK